MTTHFPVIIVGAGPVGLTTALELDHHGVRCVVVEPRTVVENSRPRAKTTSARSMEHFRRLGVADRIRRAAPIKVDWSNRISFVDTVVGREIAHIDGALGLAVPPALSPEPGQQISQGMVEKVLRGAIGGRLGITTLFGARAVAVTQGDAVATVAVETEDGTQRRLTADWVVGADGPRSVVRAAMGARYEGAPGGRP
ncbi:MAG: FAD-dependent monooxygenase, partial [Microbacterium sp.]